MVLKPGAEARAQAVPARTILLEGASRSLTIDGYAVCSQAFYCSILGTDAVTLPAFSTAYREPRGTATRQPKLNCAPAIAPPYRCHSNIQLGMLSQVMQSPASRVWGARQSPADIAPASAE